MKSSAANGMAAALRLGFVRPPRSKGYVKKKWICGRAFGVGWLVGLWVWFRDRTRKPKAEKPKVSGSVDLIFI